MNCLMRSNGTWVTRANVETTPNVWTNHRIRGFLENQFFVFWGGPKTFLDPQKLYLALETSLFGGSYFYNFLIRAPVLEIFRCQKKAILPPVAPKPKLRSKSFRSMTPPKVGSLRPKKVFGGPKRF